MIEVFFIAFQQKFFVVNNPLKTIRCKAYLHAFRNLIGQQLAMPVRWTQIYWWIRLIV